MRKFWVLLGKEIRELLTPQLLAPLILTVVLFLVVGQVIGSEIEKTQKPQPLVFSDQDKSQITEQISKTLEESGIKVVEATDQADARGLIQLAAENKAAGAVVIPAGFSRAINEQQAAQMPVYTIVESFSVTAGQRLAIVDRAISIITEQVKRQVITSGLPDANLEFFSRPIVVDPNVSVAGRVAQISPQAVLGFVSSQSTFIPIILFLVIILASQLIATTMATEKENKTIETLLAAPVRRSMIVAAKLIAAGIVSGLMAGVYLVGFRSYIGGLMGSAGASVQSDALNEALGQLGLLFSTSDYILLGLSLFVGILAALSIAMLLGSFIEDAKSVPGVISPLMVLIAIPYFLALFLDINTLSPVVRWLVYAIPFSHPFLASSNILLGNYQVVWYGIAYQAVFFLVFVVIVAKVFASDRIFTMRLKFRRR